MVANERAWNPQIVQAAALHGVVVLQDPEGITVVVEVPARPGQALEVDVDDRSLRVRAEGASPDGFQCLVGLGRRIDPSSVSVEVSGGFLVASARNAEGVAQAPRVLRVAAS